MEDKEVLSIRIDYSEPLELKKFTASMLAVESQYKMFLASENYPSDDYQLFVHKVAEGSIVIDFLKEKAKKLFEEHVLGKFLETLERKITAIKKQEPNENKKDLKDIATISNVIGSDYSSKMTINVLVGSKITNNYELNGLEAYAVKNECVRQLAITSQVGEVVERVTLHWKSAVDNKKSQSVDQGIIEEVEPEKKVKLLCEEDLKKEMISENEKNPFNMFFIVDAEIKRVAGKPVAYVIIKIYDSGKIEDGYSSI